MKFIRSLTVMSMVCAACSGEPESNPTTSQMPSMDAGVMPPSDMPEEVTDLAQGEDVPADQPVDEDMPGMIVTDMAPDLAPQDMAPEQDLAPDMSEPPQDMATSPDTIPIVVALGWTGLSMVSIDEGRSWCQTGLMADGHDDLYRGGGYHDGLWVGGHAGRGNRGAIITSSDGYTWDALHKTNTDETLPDNPTRQWYAGAAYQNGQWIAAGGCGRWATSPDGVTWTAQDRFVEGCLHIRAIAAGGGEFVVADDESRWWSSSDGQTWTRLDGERSKNVVWTGQEFSEELEFRGRGSCLWVEGGGSSSRMMRSDDTTCDNGVEVGRPGHKINVFLYGHAPASAYEHSALPADLAQCLGITQP